MKKEIKSLCRRLLAGSMILSAVLIVAAGGFTWWSASTLPALSRTLAEVAMEQGARCEAAGDLEAAREHYERALSGNFHGPENRNHCEKRMGVVLNRMGRYEEALVYLERAQRDEHRSINGFDPLVETLIALGRWDDAGAAAAQWRDESEHIPENLAKASQALGRIALHQGDLATAEGHLEKANELDPNLSARGDLARVYAAQGKQAKARDTMAAYLATAAPDDDTVANWALLESWMP